MNEKISIENYEAFMLDYIEGRLNAEQEIALFEFLAQHPEIEASLDMDLPTLSEETVVFEEKSALLRDEITPDNRSYYFIAYQENQLTSQERSEVLAFLEKNPALKSEFEQYQKAVLEKEYILYPNKHKLIERENRRIIPMWAYSAAASVAVLIGGYFFFQGEEMYNPRAGKFSIAFVDDLDEKFDLSLANAISIPNQVEQPIKNSKSSGKPVQNETRLTSKGGIVSIKSRKAQLIELTPNYTHPEKVQEPENIFVAQHDEENMAKSEKPLTVQEFLAVKTREIIGKENPTPDRKVDSEDMETALAYAIRKVSGKPSPVVKEETETTKTTGFRVGSFEYKRIVAKN